VKKLLHKDLQKMLQTSGVASPKICGAKNLGGAKCLILGE